MNIKPVKLYKKILVALSCTLFLTPVLAEDIDLFVGRSASVDPPTVMLTWESPSNTAANKRHNCRYIDGSGNVTSVDPSLGADTVGGMEQCAIVNALQTIRNSPELHGTLRVGLMTYNDNKTGVGGGNCGYLMVTPRLLDIAGLDSFITTMKELTGLPGNTSKVGETVAEVWAALNGLPTSCSGRDYSEFATTSTNCSNAVMIYIGNAVKTTANPSDGTDDPGGELLTELGKFYTPGSNKYNEFATIRSGNLTPADKYWADEWTRFMRYADVDVSAQADRNVTTYTVAVFDEDFLRFDKVANTLTFYQEMAAVGGGESYLVKSTEADALTRILLEIFDEVQDVNSVFSSATLPVSANTQGTYENQIYIAMFRPDPSGGPRWVGNVKQFQFGVNDAGSIVLTDADDSTTGSNSIVNAITGGLVDDALSFWTANDFSSVADRPASPDGFWRNSPEGDGGSQDAPDGDLVQKGGAAQMLRVDYLTSSSARRVYTNKCSAGNCNAAGLANFDASNSDLTGYFDTLLSASSSSTLSSITAGAYGTADGSVSCEKVKGKWNCNYSLTPTSVSITSGGSAFDFNATYDSVLLGSGIPGSSQCSSSPCAITAGSATSFTLYNMGSNISGSFSAGTITKVSKFIKVNQSSHGISGTQTLKSCVRNGESGSDDIFNGTAVTSGDVVLSSVNTVDTDNYTGVFESAVFIAPSASVQCGSSGDTLTAANLINWIRGDDIAGNEAMTGPCPQGSRNASCPISIRGSVHGDVLHSRPAVVNYGSGTGVVVYYGSNDGHFRAINGNQTASITNGTVTVRPGGELWSFVAKDFLNQFPRLFRDDPAIRFPDTPVSSNKERRQYFFDGTTTFFQDDRASSATSGHKYLYLSSRRGGRFIYAMDVTNPLAPSLMWKIDNSIINELGYTWSQPKVTKIGGRDRPVLIFGAGYSTTQDADPVTTADNMGRGVIILDGITGKIIWASLYSCTGIGASNYASLTTEGVAGSCSANTNLTSAFAADITFLDRRADGYTDRLYASDVGGNIWRVDLDPLTSYTGTGTSVPSTQIAISKFAALAGTGNDKRKFLFGVDIIPTATRDLVVAVSGDREHPLYTSAATLGTAQNVQNRFYMLIDSNIGASAGSTAAIVNSNLLNQAVDSNNDITNCFDAATSGYDKLTVDSADNNATACTGTNSERYVFDGRNTTYKGYYFNLSTGEKGVNAPLTEAGTVYFATNQPDTRTNTTSCKSGLGRAFAYKVNLFDGSRTTTEYSGGGLPPSPISGLVNLNDEIRFFIMGGDGDSIYKPSNGKVINSGRKRMYYFYR
ncbi:MAG: PilC/PilY family type IV pilus protein [Zhongshania sp.]|uniref:pilus assembly protein n=1 Tax=Zhongshania sp. TaxID=1971902 RepID=UPI00261A21CD|nr:PilC/PilY family type IV pilus protein [Zhongshania sp.]MDF1691184.1 PilC/PilY family type IV pilus protein [Zhongshania sp.]